MSALYYQFVSSHSTTWCHARTCDMPGCKSKVERVGPHPTREGSNDPKYRFPPGAFEGWTCITRTLFTTNSTIGDDDIDVRLDICAECSGVLLDSWLAVGLDPTHGKSKTIYLDTNGNEVENESVLRGQPMCVWRAESRVGVRPCRRFRGHEGECSPNAEGCGCPLCDDGHDATDETRPPFIYTERALGHHALTRHAIERHADGWYITWGATRGPYATVHDALEASARGYS